MDCWSFPPAVLLAVIPKTKDKYKKAKQQWKKELMDLIKSF